MAAGIAVNRDINPVPAVMGEDTRGVLSLRSAVLTERKKLSLELPPAIGALPTAGSHDGRETVTGFGEKMIVEPIIRRISYQTRPAKQ